MVGAAAWKPVRSTRWLGGPSTLQLDPAGASSCPATTSATSTGSIRHRRCADRDPPRLWDRCAAAVDGRPTGTADPRCSDRLVGTADGVLHGLFADDLSEDWAFRTGGPITIDTDGRGSRPDRRPSLTSIVSLGDGNLYGLANVAGDVGTVWTAPIGVPLNSSPALANGVVYLGADDSRLRALDAASGRVLFESDAITHTQSSPIVVDGQVIVGTSHGELMASTSRSEHGTTWRGRSVHGMNL